ncbi:MAG: histidinol-phosphate transaminase [Fimbriimonas sp.]|nr:histidinol-phosphate transaminase [Fimbriimonas sp.]
MIPIRSSVLRMEPYQPGKPIDDVKRELGLERVVKLASNENPYGPSPKAVAAVKRVAEKMHLYPDGSAHELKEALSTRIGLPVENLIMGNGSDELIHLIGLVFLNSEQDELIVGDPSFSRYDAAAQIGPSRLVKVPLDSNFVHDLAAMSRAVTEHTRLIIIANPNNPTGTIVRKAEFDRFLADVPTCVLVVLDEAYFEFATGAGDFPNARDYVGAGRNVIGLRTFSKAYGLAGIRIGYGFGPAEVIDAINRVREPFNANSLAQVAAIAALDDEEHVSKTVENNRRGLEFLAGVFVEVGAKPMESFANFMYADLGRPARPVFQALLERGVITRSGHALGNPTCLRVSVGTEEEMQIFAEELRNVMSTAGAR